MSNMFLMQGYQAQHFSNRDSVMVQLKKGGEWQALLGMQAALTVTMNRTSGGPDINLAGMPDAGTVSRNHAVIELTDDNPTLTDLNSANSTRINDHIIEPRYGDTI